MLKIKNYEDMLSEALGYLQNHSEITMVSPGSAARTLVEANIAEVASLYALADLSMKMAFLSTASGFFLDMIGELVGVTRRNETYAYVRNTDRNIRFFVNSGTLGDYIPKSGDPTKCQVPAGTTIQNSAGDIIFVTDVDHEAPASATEIWVSARAQTVGTAGNAGPNTLSYSSLPSSVQVENVSAITTGSSLEDDESLRYRIRNAVIVAEGSNRSAIEDAAIQVAGVSDVILNEFPSGAGSFELILIPDGNRVPFESLMQVRARIAGISAFGVNFTVREPRYLPIALDIELTMDRARDVEKPLIRDLVAGRVSRYVGTLRPTETLYMGRIREAALGASRLVSDVHIRSFRVNGVPQMIADYVLGSDEIFIPDPDETKPFQVI